MNPPTSTPPASPSASPASCPLCGSPIPTDPAAEGLCPRCVAAGNFLTGSLFAGTATRAGQAASAPAPSPEDLACFFPQLEIQRLLGRGGMGLVYLTRQKSLDRLVALKLLAPDHADDPTFAARFTTEAQALARLHHPHIVTVHDFGAAGAYYYLLMEYVDGLNLRQLQQAGRVEPREALAIVPQICDALQYAHDHGVVHRDIKPENILVDRQGRVKVADFGLAKLATSGPSAPETVVMGTPAYMSPEQKSHPDRVDHRSDIYALGAVLYEMLTGARPGSPLQNPSRDLRVDVRLDEVVLRALAHEPALRWQQASEVKTRLETIAASPAASPRKKRPLTPVIAAAATCLAAGLAVFASIRSRSEPNLALVAAPAPAPSPASAPRIQGDVIDLEPWQTSRASGPASRAKQALETFSGEQIFDGLGFRVTGQITLKGDAFNGFPARVPAIALGDRSFDELHLLHVAYNPNPQGDPVAILRLHYTDGHAADLPLAYGVHVREWSRTAAEERERLDDPDSKVVFRDLKANEHAETSRVFKTRLRNPDPTKPVRALELAAAPGAASYSLLAATTSHADPARPVTPAVESNEPERVFDREIRLRVVDGETGAPVPAALIRTGGEYLGMDTNAEPLRTDVAGEAVFRYPHSGRLRARHLWFRLVATEQNASQTLNFDLVLPRVAYFFSKPKNSPETSRTTEDRPDQLPAWRHEAARRLLREYGLGRLTALEKATPDVSKAIRAEQVAYADLGALVQGTRGETLWHASQLRAKATTSPAKQGAPDKGRTAQPLYSPDQEAKKDFAAWVWAQISPDEPALPDLTPSRHQRPADAPARPADWSKLRLLLDIHAKGGRPEQRDAVLAELKGTDLDLAIERSFGFSTDPYKIPPSMHNDGELARIIRQVAERGQVHDVNRLWVQRQELPDSVLFLLRSRLETGDRTIPAQTGNAGEGITSFRQAFEQGRLTIQRESILKQNDPRQPRSPATDDQKPEAELPRSPDSDANR